MVERSKKHRSSLVLVGASGVGKRSFKERLVRDFPEKYGAAVPRKIFKIFVIIFDSCSLNTNLNTSDKVIKHL